VNFMRKGMFAEYRGSIYQAEIIDDLQIKLVSRDVKDQALGFKLKIYPEYYKGIKNLPEIYLKDVNKDDIIELFEVNPKSKYKGYKFNISGEKNGHVHIGTNDATLAKDLGFERTDKYYYEKWVPKNEVEIFEERKEIKL
jgi:hypothetical protein